MHWSELTMPAAPDLVGVARQMAIATSRVARLPEARAHDVRTCVSEAVTNAIQAHASAGVVAPIVVRIGYDETQMVVEIRDRGPGLPDTVGLPASMPDAEQLEWPAEGGYGLPVMEALADSVDVSPAEDGRGTTVSLSFSVRQDANAS